MARIDALRKQQQKVDVGRKHPRGRRDKERGEKWDAFSDRIARLESGLPENAPGAAAPHLSAAALSAAVAEHAAHHAARTKLPRGNPYQDRARPSAALTDRHLSVLPAGRDAQHARARRNESRDSEFSLSTLSYRAAAYSRSTLANDPRTRSRRRAATTRPRAR